MDNFKCHGSFSYSIVRGKPCYMCRWQRLYMLAENTFTEICSSWPIGIFAFLVVSDFIISSLALPYSVTEQRVAPSGEIRVLQY